MPFINTHSNEMHHSSKLIAQAVIIVMDESNIKHAKGDERWSHNTIQISHRNSVYSSRSSPQTKSNRHGSTRDSSSETYFHQVTCYVSNPQPTYYTSLPPIQLPLEAVWPIAVVEPVAIMISNFVLISELQGEELEQLSLRKVYKVPSLSIPSREVIFFSGVPVSVVKVLLKESTEICSEDIP